MTSVIIMEALAGVVIIALMFGMSFLLREVIHIRRALLAHERAIGSLMVHRDKTKAQG